MSQALEDPIESPITSHTEYDAVVVGAGFAGMYQLYRLRELGLSVRVFETGDGVGGTWYWNRYPGARVDSPSMQYSLSFSSEMEQEWNWPEDYSAQVVARDATPTTSPTASTCAKTSSSAPRSPGRPTTRRASAGRSRPTAATRFSAKYFITAAGCLSATNVPNFKGIETFEGEWYHTSRWPKEGVDLTGKRVGIIGTGSTGIQAIPVMAEARPAHLYVFQRTPNYSLPSNNKPMDPAFEADWKERLRRAPRRTRGVSPGGARGRRLPRRARPCRSAKRSATQVFEAAWGQGAFTHARAASPT